MRELNTIISIREQIAQQLRTDIISGDLPENTKLKEHALAERFGVSRGPIRDVLIQLSKEGLLISKNNCGSMVNSAPQSQTQPLMISLRLNIETYALEQCIKTLTKDDFLNIERILDNLSHAFSQEDYTLVTDLDMSFHHYFVNKAGGEELVNLWKPFVYRMRMNYKRITNAEACYKEHNNILQALKDKDIEAVIKALKANIR